METRWITRLGSMVLLVVVFTYCALVLAGVLTESERLGAGEITALIVVVTLAFGTWFPAVLREQVKSLKVAGVEVELREALSDLRTRQDMLIELLPLLIPSHEFVHLENLQRGAVHYQHSGELRTELRHLRGMGLIASVPGRNVGDIQTDQSFSLSDYVALTERGRHWITLRRSANVDTTDEQILPE